MKICLAKKTDLKGIKSLLDKQYIFHEKEGFTSFMESKEMRLIKA